MPDSDDKINRIEELKKRLFSKNEKLLRQKKPGVLHPSSYDVPESWNVLDIKTPPKRKFSLPPSIFKRIFLSSLIFFSLALIFAVVVFERGSNSVSSDNIDISVLGNTFTAGGEDLDLQIEVVNRNAVALEYSDLLVEYPKGSSGDASGDFVRIRKSLATIGGGKSARENIKVVLFGEQGSIKDIKTTLEYRVHGSNAIFVKEKTYAVTISSAPLDLTIDAPTEASSNQKITLNIKATLNAGKDVQGVALKVDYPPGFQFESATPKSVAGNNFFALGDLSPGVEKNISITGTVFGQDAEERAFHVYSGEADPNDQSAISVIYSSLVHTIVIKRPFIEANLFINGTDQQSYSVPSGAAIQGEIHWVNNSPTRIENVEIHARITGSALNKSSIGVLTGFYNSTTDEIIWDRNTTSRFASIEPGDNGTLSFTFSPLSLLSTNRSLLENPEIIIEISMKGLEPSDGNIPAEVNNAQTKTIKISSDFQMAAQALYHSGPFVNTGPIPPRVEQETAYTIDWIVTNSSNSISGAEARTSLPLYVSWAGNVSPSTENVFYNEATREVVWNIGSVAKGAGLTGSGREAAFQVTLLPSLSQVGSIPVLTNETTLKGTDNFTNTAIQTKKSQLNARLTNDPGFREGDDRVVQ